MKRPAVFFDRDNTLIANDGYLGDPAQVVLIDGAADAIARCRSLGYAVVVISNQSGVARGMFDEEAVHAVNHRMEQLLKAAHPHAIIDRHEFCPYHPDGTVAQYRRESELRKPRPGMILQAARSLALDLPRSWLIGDAPRDIEAGRAVGCRTILFHDPSLPASPAASSGEARADYAAASLREAVDIVEQHPRVAGDDAEALAAAAVAPLTDPGPPADAPPALHIAGTPAADSSVVDHDRLTERLAPAGQPPPPSLHIAGTADGDAGVTQHDAPLAENLASGATAPPTMHIAPESAGRKSHIFKQGFPFDAQATPAAADAAARTPQLAIDPPPPHTPSASVNTEKLERLVEQLIGEVKRQHEQPPADFSVPKLLAGIAQMVAIAAGIFAYFERNDGAVPTQLLLTAILLQGLTASLLLMGRQR